MNYKLSWYKTVLIMLKRGVGFGGSADYWEQRYAKGGHSGDGSYGRLAKFKADFLNNFVQGHGVDSVLEFGCGDGNQLKLAAYPAYTGVDVSSRSIEICRRLFAGDATKTFVLASDYDNISSDLVLSLDVIYHLVEDAVFESYMRQLFSAARRYVIIYSSNSADLFAESPHVRPREFTEWVAANQPGWRLAGMTPNRYPVGAESRETSFAHFFIFELAA
jgi:SAM-dependent methyltransferase